MDAISTDESMLPFPACGRPESPGLESGGPLLQYRALRRDHAPKTNLRCVMR